MLFKKRARNSLVDSKTDLVANHIASRIIYYQTNFARYLERISQTVPLKIQGYTLLTFACLGLCYCGLLIFGEHSSALKINSIEPLKETRISSADSLNKLENIYQHYLKQ